MGLERDDGVLLVGLLVLTCAIYLGLGGVAALAFLGTVITSVGLAMAWLKRQNRMKR